MLVTGGNPAALYDPAAGTFTATGSLGGGTATLLNNGNVLIAGGDSAELYLPGTLTPTGLVSITVTPTTPAVSAELNAAIHRHRNFQRQQHADPPVSDMEFL